MDDDAGDDLTQEQITLGLYIEALIFLQTGSESKRVQMDARIMLYARIPDTSIDAAWPTNTLNQLRVTGFLRACASGKDILVHRVKKIFPHVIDIIGLANALRVEYTIRKLGGRDGQPLAG